MVSGKSLFMETLHDPSVEGYPTTVDVVLIHGFNGDSVKTWTHGKSGVCWPRDLLPKAIPRARVLSLGYNADIYGNTSVAGIRDNAEILLSRLRDVREELDSSRPIVFVAHSLGGIVVKQALYAAQKDRRYQHLLSATHGLLFYGTPHFGADRSRWLSMAKSFALLSPRRFRRGRHSKLVDSLTNNSSDIWNICEDFRVLARRFAIVSFYETEMWPGTSAPVVDKTSALMHLDHEQQMPLAVNHADLCRFMDAEDPGFMLTCGFLRRIAQDIGHLQYERQLEVVPV